MDRKSLYPGLKVEDNYNNQYHVISTATWKQAEYSFQIDEVYTFMGEEYKVAGSIQPRGRYVLLKGVKNGRPILKRPSDLNPIGTYKEAQFRTYVYMSNHRIRQMEKEELLLGKLRAFWGDAYTVVITKFNLDSTTFNWEFKMNQAIEYGKIHYANR